MSLRHKDSFSAFCFLQYDNCIRAKNMHLNIINYKYFHTFTSFHMKSNFGFLKILLYTSLSILLPFDLLSLNEVVRYFKASSTENMFYGLANSRTASFTPYTFSLFIVQRLCRSITFFTALCSNN